MKRLFWIAAIGVFLGLSSAPAAATPAYPGAGNPDDVYSCFSHCDRSAPPAASVCYCDRGCEARGDCCADRQEFCAPETVKPACAVTSNSGFSNFCGTDLGFVYQHGPIWKSCSAIPGRRPPARRRATTAATITSPAMTRKGVCP